ncbi:MAG TPA: hypothetical protein VGD29_31080 [Actinoplanes sp.]
MSDDNGLAAGDAGLEVLPQHGQISFNGLLGGTKQFGQLRDGRLAAQCEQGEQLTRSIAAEVVAGQALAAGPDLEPTEELDVEHESELCV